MRQTHRPGEKLFIDYSGKRPFFIDSDTGEVHEVELFVAAPSVSPNKGGPVFARAISLQANPSSWCRPAKLCS